MTESNKMSDAETILAQQATIEKMRDAIIDNQRAIKSIMLDDNYHEAKCDLDDVYELIQIASTNSQQALSLTPNLSLLDAYVNEQFEFIGCAANEGLLTGLDTFEKLYIRNQVEE